MSPGAHASRSAPTPREAMDEALTELARTRLGWAELPAAAKADLLRRMRRDLHAVADEWSMAAAEAKGVAGDSREGGEEWLTFAFLLRAVAMLERSLRAVARGRRPPLPGPVTNCGDGQLSVQVFPGSLYDRLLYPGMVSQVWTEPGVSVDDIERGWGGLGGEPTRSGSTVLVLGAGNVSILGPCDILDKTFCEGAVVVYKTHPVTDHLTPLLERGFAALIEAGALRIVRGDAGEGSYLAGHDLVDAIHLTGSHCTHDAIVYGAGPEGEVRRWAGKPLLDKPFTSELGCVSPLIVVPGPWRRGDIAYQAEHLAAMQVVNAGFNCLSTRVIIQHADWEQRAALLDALRRVLGRTPTRPAYYPRSHCLHRRFVEAHPETEFFGEGGGSLLPWTLIAGLDPERGDDISFREEAFCSLVAETALAADDVPGFLDRAVSFANDTLWGSLTATIVVHPRSLADPQVAAAVERAVRDLRYGTVGVNLWGVLNYITMAGSWGAFPGHPTADIQSGRGTVHNYLGVPRPQKTVIRGPFRQWPKPVVFPSHRTLPALGRRLAALEAAPSPLRLPGLLAAAMRA